MLGLQDIGKNFWTETGYLARNGLTRFRSGAVRMFYPKSNTLKRIDILIHSNQIKDKFSGLNETYNSGDLRLIFPNSTSFLFGGRYATEIFLNKRFRMNGARFVASRQFTKNLSLSLMYNTGGKIRYLENPYQGRGNGASAAVTYLPSEKLHLNLSLVYSDFVRSSDSIKEYDYTIVRGRTTYQLNKYLFFRGIVEYNSFRKRILTDFLASFTYIPGRGFFFKASFLWRL